LKAGHTPDEAGAGAEREDAEVGPDPTRFDTRMGPDRPPLHPEHDVLEGRRRRRALCARIPDPAHEHPEHQPHPPPRPHVHALPRPAAASERIRWPAPPAAY